MARSRLVLQALRFSLSVLLASGGLVASSLSQCSAGANAGRSERARFDPRALDLLHKLSGAYEAITSLDERTDVTSQFVPTGSGAARAADPPSPIRSLRLQYTSPNRLDMQTFDTEGDARAPLTRIVSDGKFFYSYDAIKKLYTKERAPGALREFTKLNYLGAGSLELALLMGQNPFSGVREQMEAVEYLGDGQANGAAVEIVEMRSTNPIEHSAMRLFIGKSDGLLYRLQIEATPILSGTGPIKTGSPLDELLPVDPPAPRPDPSLPPEAQVQPAPSRPRASITTMDNHYAPAPTFAPDAFVWTLPDGALAYNGPGTVRSYKTLKERIAEIAKANHQPRTRKPRVIHF